VPSTFSQRLSCGDRGLNLIIQATLNPIPSICPANSSASP